MKSKRAASGKMKVVLEKSKENALLKGKLDRLQPEDTQAETRQTRILGDIQQ